MTAATIEIQKGHPAHTEDTGAHHDHVLPVSIYVKVYGALLVFTYLTVQVSYLPLGGASLPIAMVVALVKAGLVIGFFMHLRYDVRFNSLVFFGAALFIVIFFSFTMIDLLSRGALVPEAETEVLHRQGDDIAAAQAEAAALAAPPVAEGTGAETTAPAPDGGHHKPSPIKATARR